MVIVVAVAVIIIMIILIENIVVINVKKRIKTLKTRFIPKIKKTFVNVIKNVTPFLLAFDVRAY